MNELNQYQKELEQADFVRVDGIIAYAYGDPELAFIIPKPSDYPEKKFIAGRDFIFVFEKDSDQTWYKSVDLTQEGTFRSNLFYIGYELTGEDDNEKDGVNINQTSFSYFFTFDEEMFEARKLTINYCPEIVEFSHSCESILIQFSGDISRTVDQFIGLLHGFREDILKPLPNPEFFKVFGIKGMNEDKPVLPGHIRHFYMLAVLLSWREGKFPYGLTYKRFHKLIVVPQPPYRCR